MISYRIDLHNPNAHLYRVTLTVPRPAATQRLSLPVWIPGSYLVREFARHVSGLEATQGSRAVPRSVPRAVPLTQLDKATWQAECSGRGALVVTYLVYAFDTSVRAAFLDAQRGFFNGTSLCLRVEGRESEPHRIELRSLPRGWQVATSMSATAATVFEAADYDELVDHPFELGTFWRGQFKAHGVPHELVVAGALPDFDGARLLADTKRICETEIAFWHGDTPKRSDIPFQRYVFLLNSVDDGYGGLEHRASTALIASRRDLPRLRVQGVPRDELSDGYVTLLGLISHEYFHTWNVKRLKPRDFAPYDYTRENYTELLWFFEGFTSYYDDLLLRRAGLIDEARYLKAVAKTVGNVLGMPGRQVQSVAQASFDAWVKYYRGDENTPNATISYYTKGSLVALALDLSLRSHGSRRQATLDAVMRGLWARSAGGPITEADIVEVLRNVAGPAQADALSRQLNEWVHGTADLPLQDLLQRFGVQWQAPPATLAQRLGLRVSESALTGIKVTQVLRGGAAERAGLSAGDEVLALGDWRLRRLDDALRLLTPGQPAVLLVSRDQRLLRLSLEAPESADVAGAVSLTADTQAARAALALRTAWLGG